MESFLYGECDNVTIEPGVRLKKIKNGFFVVNNGNRYIKTTNNYYCPPMLNRSKKKNGQLQ